MNFSRLSIYLEKLEKTSSRNEITKILSEVFEKSKPDEIDKITYLLLGILAPSYKGIVFNIAEKMVIRIISKAYETPVEKVKSIYREKGDLGTTALTLAKKTKSKDLSVSKVYETMLMAAKEAGEGSQERKVEKMSTLLSQLDPLSAKYVTRIPLGKLRLGFSDLTIIDALSWYENKDKSAKKNLEKAYRVMPDIGILAQKVKKQGIKDTVKNTHPILGTPIMPMLAQPLKSPQEMIKKMNKVFIEPKFDGVRLSIHLKTDNGFIKAYTRNLNETSFMFPELKDAKKNINADQVILDCEAVGLNEETLKTVNFQTTMRRRRKHEIDQFLSKVPLRFYVFDCLFLNGKSLMDTPYSKRREILKKVIKKDSKLFQIVEYQETTNPQEIEKYYHEKLSEGLEGIMVKKSDTSYIPGRTGWRWVKMKEEEQKSGKLADTVDAIVMGFTSGQGKRTSFGIGQFLAGIKKGENILTITKVGTGLTDEQFKELKKRLDVIKTSTMPREYQVSKNLTPDFWVTPQLVVELAADEITKSPIHTAGLALRFPRLIKFRDDKSFNEATTLSQIEKLFKLQNKS